MSQRLERVRQLDLHSQSFIAQRPEHCNECYRLILAGETYYETPENTALCELCVTNSAEVLEKIQVSDDLVIERLEHGLRIRSGIAGVVVRHDDIGRLVDVLVPELLAQGRSKATLEDLMDLEVRCSRWGAVLADPEAVMAHEAECEKVLISGECGDRFIDRDAFRQHVFGHLYPKSKE